MGDMLKQHPDAPQSFQTLEALLNSGDDHFTRDLVNAVREAKYSPAVALLRPLLNAADDYLRRDLIQLIGAFGESSDIETLSALTQDKSFSVSYAAKQAIEAINKRVPAEVVKEPEAQAASAVEEPQACVETSASAVEALVEEEGAVDSEEPQAPEPAVAVERSETSEVETAQETQANDPLVEAVIEEKTVKTAVAAEPARESIVHRREKTSSADERSMREQLPDCLHDNSIFEKETTSETLADFDDRITDSVFSAVPALPTGGIAEKSTNLKNFFGVDYQLSLSLYRQLHDQRVDLPRKESRLSESIRQLTLLEADKADDLESSDESMGESSKELQDLEWNIKKCKVKIDKIKDENSSLFNSMLSVFSGGHKQEADEKVATAEKELDKLKKKAAMTHGELKRHQGVSSSLKKPIVDLQKEVHQRKKERDEILLKVQSSEEEINLLYHKVLLESSSLELESKLAVLKDSGNSSLAKGISSHLAVLLNKLNSLQEVEKKEELHFKELQAAGAAHLEHLSKEICSSIHTVTHKRKEKVSIQASLKFEEEKGFWGYSGASGSAAGSGSARATYQIEESEWRQSAQLKNSLNDFSRGYGVLGSKSSALEFIALDIKTTKESLNAYLDYLRIAVEQDFEAEA